MKKSIAIIATLTLLGINAQAQTDKSAAPASQKKEQPVKGEMANPDGSTPAQTPPTAAPQDHPVTPAGGQVGIQAAPAPEKMEAAPKNKIEPKPTDNKSARPANKKATTPKSQSK